MATAAMASLLIDGSMLEGGGQILRNSAALAALLCRPISISNVRGNRKPPGLKSQHAAGLRLAAEICSADVSGCEKGSCAVDFHPGPIQLPGNFTADPQTAGSTTLLLQIALPCLLFSRDPTRSKLTLRGGTNALQAPQIDYTDEVFLPFLRRHLRLEPKLNIRKRGFFPKGGGEVQFFMPPVSGPLPAVTLTERGPLKRVSGRAYVAGLPRRLAERIRDGAQSHLVASGIDPAIIDISAVRERDEDVVGAGSGVVLWAETEHGCRLGGSAVGSKGKDPVALGAEAAAELARNIQHGGCVDEYLQDQMIIFLALAKGKSSVRTGPLTLHTRTAIWIAEQLTSARFEVQEDTTTDTALISCEGIGFTVSEERSADSASEP